MALSVRDKILSYLKVKFKDIYTPEELDNLADEILQWSDIFINLYEQQKSEGSNLL